MELKILIFVVSPSLVYLRIRLNYDFLHFLLLQQLTTTFTTVVEKALLSLFFLFLV